MPWNEIDEEEEEEEEEEDSLEDYLTDDLLDEAIPWMPQYEIQAKVDSQNFDGSNFYDDCQHDDETWMSLCENICLQQDCVIS